MNKLFTLLTLIFSFSVLAESDLKSEYLNDLKEEKNWTVHFGGWSYHFERNPKNNENNKLLALQYKNVVMGTFKNTYSEQTFLIGYATDDFHIAGPVYVGGWIGATYGYTEEQVNVNIKGTKITPMIAPYFKIKYEDLGIDIGVLGDVTMFIKLNYNF